MKGLLYKDFKSILKLISPVYLMSLIPIIVYIGKDMFLFMFSIIIGILFGMQVSITISVDEKTKLVNYYRILHFLKKFYFLPKCKKYQYSK